MGCGHTGVGGVREGSHNGVLRMHEGALNPKPRLTEVIFILNFALQYRLRDGSDMAEVIRLSKGK